MSLLLLQVPQEDLTCHNFGMEQYSHLSDRQYFAWALQTETKIRFGKLEARHSATTSATSSSTSSSASEHLTTTLKSDYLIDIYPCDKNDDTTTKFHNTWERDKAAWERKAVAYLSHVKEPDGSLRPIDIRGHDRMSYALSSLSSSSKTTPLLELEEECIMAVPPNLLYFEMCLTAFTGYNLQGLYNSNDPAMPRAAMMGGAIVAALTSWRDPCIIHMFQSMMDHVFQEPTSSNAMDLEQYSKLKTRVITKLHGHFHLSSDSGVYSPFYQGDVDIFLELSPTTRNIRQKLVPDTVLYDKIQAFCKIGLGETHYDLLGFSKAILQRLEASLNKEAQGKFVPVVSHTGLSFMLALDQESRHEEDSYYSDHEPQQGEYWPRPTQLIMLQPGADLLGALMDFDLSIVTCAYDGTSVRVTPRAALSLQRMLCVVTPFCFEEKRNKSRVLKYYKRGFIPAILDPNCQHQVECINCDALLVKEEPRTQGNTAPSSEGGLWKARDLHGQDYETVLDRVNEQDEPEFCCCEQGSTDTCNYAMALIERSEGDATAFFAKMFQWTPEQLQEVEWVPNDGRLACKKCRNDYSMSLFFRGAVPVDESDDMLRSEKSFWKTRGDSGYLAPSFYSGPVFDSVRVWDKARCYNKACSSIQGQMVAERIRYILKHGTDEGFRSRLVSYLPIFEDRKSKSVQDPLEKLFQKVAQHQFPASGRPPIGLNPERIVARCKSEYCTKWLHNYEFGTEFCDQCAESKPVAKRIKHTSGPDI